MSELPLFARDILAAVPERGGGLNQWLMRAAIALRAVGRTEQEITATLSIQTAGEALKAGEISEPSSGPPGTWGKRDFARTFPKLWGTCPPGLAQSRQGGTGGRGCRA